MSAPTWQATLSRHPLAQRADDPQFWDKYLAERPEVLHNLLADLWRLTRDASTPPTLDDLWDLVAEQQFSNQSFGTAVRDLMALRKKSLRGLSREVGVAHQQMQRYLSGAQPIVNLHDHIGSMRRMEAVARALSVHPSFFADYRRLWVLSLVDSVFQVKPGLSVGLFKRYAGFESKATP